jgi:hypothetical protein
MKRTPALSLQDRKRIAELVALFVLRLAPCPSGKLFKLLYLLDVLHFQAIARTATGLVYHAHREGPVPSRLEGELHTLAMGEHCRGERSILPKALKTMNSGRHILLSVTEGAWSDQYDQISPRMFGIMETLIRSLGAIATEHFNVSGYDYGAWMKQAIHKKPEAINFGDSLNPNDPRTPELLDLAESYRMRKLALAALKRCT